MAKVDDGTFHGMNVRMDKNTKEARAEIVHRALAKAEQAAKNFAGLMKDTETATLTLTDAIFSTMLVQQIAAEALYVAEIEDIDSCVLQFLKKIVGVCEKSLNTYGIKSGYKKEEGEENK